MQPFARFLEEVRLGIVHDPHTDHHTLLTEMVTVCPSCRGLNSLRLYQSDVHCAECHWSTPVQENLPHA